MSRLFRVCFHSDSEWGWSPFRNSLGFDRFGLGQDCTADSKAIPKAMFRCVYRRGMELAPLDFESSYSPRIDPVFVPTNDQYDFKREVVRDDVSSSSG